MPPAVQSGREKKIDTPFARAYNKHKEDSEMLGTGEVAGPLRQRESVRALKALSTGPGEACAREQAGGNPCTGGAVIPATK